MALQWDTYECNSYVLRIQLLAYSGTDVLLVCEDVASVTIYPHISLSGAVSVSLFLTVRDADHSKISTADVQRVRCLLLARVHSLIREQAP